MTPSPHNPDRPQGAGEFARCTTCLGYGYLNIATGPVPCQLCSGSGRIPLTPAPGRDDTTGADDERRQNMARDLWRARFGDMRGWSDAEPNWALTEADRIIASNDAQVEAVAVRLRAATSGRDEASTRTTPSADRELREQIAAALREVVVGWRIATDAVMEPVDAWVAAHTAEARDGWQATLDAALRERGTYRAAVAAGPRRTTDVYRQLSEATAAVARVRALCDEAEPRHDQYEFARAIIAALPPRDPSAPPSESLTTEQTRGSEQGDEMSVESP